MLSVNPYFSSIDELFALIDDGGGGRWQTTRRRWKLRLRIWMHTNALSGAIAAFQDGQLRRLPHLEPTLLIRPLRSYLRHGLTATQRVQALRSHFAWLAETFPEAAIERLYDGSGLVLWEGPPGSSPNNLQPLRIALTCASGWGREGELALHLELAGRRLMTLAFSVVERRLAFGGTASAPVLLLGAIQGARGMDEALRVLNHAAERLRPHALLITAAQGLARGLGIHGLYGVAAASHIYAGYRTRTRRIGIDYDALWREAGASAAGPHYWTLPAQPLLRSEEEVPSRKRSQHRRRNHLRRDLFAQCESGIRRFCRSVDARSLLIEQPELCSISADFGLPAQL